MVNKNYIEMKHVKPFEQFIGEALITEGQFSWMTQDTGNQIGSEKENTITVTMFDYCCITVNMFLITGVLL
jgi:hypothetical protein